MDEMNSAIPDHVPPSKVHTWMLILLSWIAIFSLITVGLLLTKGSSSGLSATDITAACQNGSINALTTNLTRISDACNTVPDAKKTEPVAATAPVVTGTVFDAKDGQGYLPKLILPSSWSASVFMNNAHDAARRYASLSATKGIAFDCNECGGVRAPATFFVEGEDIAKASTIGDATMNGLAGSMDIAAIKAAYAKNVTAFTNIAITTESISGGTLVHIDGTFTPDGVVSHAGTFHILRFATATKIAELTFYEDQGATNAEWLALKGSLDWSTVK